MGRQHRIVQAPAARPASIQTTAIGSVGERAQGVAAAAHDVARDVHLAGEFGL